MTWPQFKKKWSRYTGKESSAYQSHFNDLCQLLGQPTPAEADPTGSESFCFQKRVVKDAELLLRMVDGGLDARSFFFEECASLLHLFLLDGVQAAGVGLGSCIGLAVTG